MIVFRDLTASEIEVRVGSMNEKGLSLLLYKNARVDMDILDEAIGPERWEREHYECKGNLFCKVGIFFDSNMEGFSGLARWVYKADCGTESNTEKEKGEASDSFKRACVNWGIGRELYTAPFIYIPAKDENGKDNYTVNAKNGKPTTKDKFFVEKIIIVDKKITALSIGNAKLKKRVFVWQK